VSRINDLRSGDRSLSHESERNRLRKLQTVLILAARDIMDQATAAAAALQADKSTNEAYRRALETAMAVCYMRAFTKSSLMTLPAEYVPTEAAGF